VSAEGAPEPRFRALIPRPPDGHETITAQEALAGWREESGSPSGEIADSLPRLALNMAASLDGRIAVGGRSAPLSSPADRALFHALRSRTDAILVGARTVRIERYGPIIKNSDSRAQRAREGLPEQPLAVIASRSVEFDPQLPLLADPDSHVVIITPSAEEMAPCAATVDYIRTPTLREGIAELASRHGVRLLLCEGGPSLNGSLAADGLVDELFLSRAPVLVGDEPGGGAVLEGHALQEPLRLELRALLELDGELYARYVRP
jgi:5-amino-6-(5-phosphoribosylamino)uracil reductase